MNTKHICILVVGVILSLLLFSCTDNAAIDTPDPNNPGAEGDVNLTVSIKLPGTDAVPYSQIALSDELTIDSVMAFAFVEKSGEFIFNKMYPFSKQDNGSGGIIIAGTTISLPITVKNTNSDMKFFFVANSGGITSLRNLTPGLATETDFLKALTNATFQGMKNQNDDNVSPLLMTTDSVRITATQLQADNPTIDNLEFKRIVARIDIRNRERTLAIDSVQFLNTPRLSLIFNKKKSNNSWQFAENGTPVSRSNFPIVRIEDDLRYPPLQKGSLTELMDSVHLKSLFFPYEGEIVDPNAVAANTSIRIWGRLNPKAGDNTSGTEVIYNLNLADGKKPNDDTPVQLLRNNRYILLIENALAHEITYNFTVNEWENDDDTVKHIMDPEIRLEYNGTKLFELETDKTGGTYTIDVNSPTDWDIQISYIDGDGWLTPSTPQTYSGIPNYFTLTTTENWGEARKAIVIVRSKVSITAEETQFTVTQPSANPLAKWAKANLRTDYTIGDDLTAETAGLASNYGAWFQWGRPIAFTNNNLTEGESIQLNYTTMDNWTTSVFYFHASGAIGGHANDKWTNFINAGDKNGANNADPCPTGYSLPSVDEWLEIVPPTSDAGTYGTSTTAIGTAGTPVSEYPGGNQIATDNSNGAFTGPSKYVGITSDGTAGEITGAKIVYGVKRMGTTNAYALRWSYIGDSSDPGASSTAGTTYLKVESIKVDDSFSGTDAAAFRSEDWSNPVVRYFPAAGGRKESDSKPYIRGIGGLYWTSSSHGVTSGWNFDFNRSNVKFWAYNRTYGLSIRCITND